MKDWLPLVGVGIGWFLNQLNQWFVSRHDERKALARVLADLMEVRHRVLAIPRAVEEIARTLNVSPSPSEAITLQVVLASMFPNDNLTNSYEESVSLVAASDPILGFRLRSQAQITPQLERLRRLALADQPAVAFYAPFEKQLIEQFKTHAQKLILKVAYLHGWRTWWKARRSLKQPLEIPPELLNSMKLAVQQAISAQQSSQSAKSVGQETGS